MSMVIIGSDGCPQTPEAAEIAEQTRRRRAAVLLQRWWRRRRFQVAAERK